MRRVLMVLLLASSGCVTTMASQVADFKARATNQVPLWSENYTELGKLNAQLEAESDQDSKSHSVDRREAIRWGSYDGSKICVSQEILEPQDLDESGTYLDRHREHAAVTSVALGAYDSWDSVPTEYPAKPPVHPENTVIDDGTTEERRRDGHGDLRTYRTTHAHLWVCGDAPEISASTRVITAVFWDVGVVPLLFAWEIQGSPRASAATATGAAAMAATTATVATAAQDPKPGQKGQPEKDPRAKVEIAPLAPGATPNILQALKASGQHSTFLKLLEVSGELGQLTSGEWTVLAPTDAAFEREFAVLGGGSEAFWGLSQRGLANYAGKHLAKGRQSPDELKALAKARDTLRLLVGSARVSFKEGAFKFGFARADPEAITATNGLIFTVDRFAQ